LVQKIENAQAIKYHRKKAKFVGKKQRKFYLGAALHDHTIVMQRRNTKNGLVRKGGKSSGWQVVKAFCWSHSLVILAVCFGSLSCWKTQP
ncbi:unnamed protein product, partial [Staurois parvus]